MIVIVVKGGKQSQPRLTLAFPVHRFESIGAMLKVGLPIYINNKCSVRGSHQESPNFPRLFVHSMQIKFLRVISALTPNTIEILQCYCLKLFVGTGACIDLDSSWRNKCQKLHVLKFILSSSFVVTYLAPT